jgi:ankyrin repeat protein
LIRPVELSGDKLFTLADGQMVSKENVYRMFVATRAGDLDAVRDLVAKAPKLAIVEYNYTPPIHFAVREGHLALVEFLLDRGADLAYKSYPFGDTLLMMAEDREHHEVAALLKQRLSQRFALAGGMKEILEGAKQGDMKRVRAELARDPSLARKSNEVGDTALHNAAQNADLPMVEMLLAAGADPDAIRGDGYRPIHLALMRGWWQGSPESQRHVIADLLLAKGARYTMQLAVLRHDVSYIREALRRDRSLANEEDTNHHRPISAAARQNDEALVRLLLDHGADPNLPEEGAERGHALWIAVHMKWRPLARLLLEHGADPTAWWNPAARR